MRAGSILPLGPEIEYTNQKPNSPIEIRIYRGANGHFDLYEDAGDTYDYAKGQHATIPMDWDDAAGQLTVGASVGTFPGMVEKHTFRVIFVGPNHGAGPEETASADGEITYTGQPATLKAH